MGNRATKETLYLKHDYTNEERLEMGSLLARAYNTLAAIEDEQKRIKSQIGDRIAAAQQTIGTVSRNLNAGHEFQNIPCTLKFDDPHPFSVSYYRDDTGELVKSRAMTEQERQQELPLKPEQEASPAVVDASVAASEQAVGEFFGKDEKKAPVENLAAQSDHDEEPGETDEDEEEEDDFPPEADEEYDPDSGARSGEAEDDSVQKYAEQAAVPVKRGRGRPRKNPVPAPAEAF